MNRSLSQVSIAMAAVCATVVAACSGTSVNGLRGVGDDLRPINGAVEMPARGALLRWEEFPRVSDDAVFGPNMRSRIANVRYDLSLWYPTGTGAWSEPVVVEGLSKPMYEIKRGSHGDELRWAARATFDLDGRRRATQWTSLRSPPPMIDTPESHPRLVFRDSQVPPPDGGR
ncbi:MAG: hypothetical protein AMXMBFR58_37230 [Phycisphaerae bacterium]